MTASVQAALIGLMLAAFSVLTGCSITTGPEMAKLEPPPGPAVLRLGSVTETPTGTWAPAAANGVREPLMELLRQPEAAALFSTDPKDLTLQIDMVNDHEDDQPRLVGLGCLSIISLGLVPLSYDSVWHVDCTATVLKSDSSVVAQYPIHVAGTYHITAWPLTMFTLLGASFRGQHDGGMVMERTANNVMAEILKSVRADYARLAQAQASNPPSAMAASRPITPASATRASVAAAPARRPFSKKASRSAGTVMAAAAPTVNELPTSEPSGVYSLEALADFDTLDAIAYDPARGTLSLSGHRARDDRKEDVHYLDLLATALDSENPVFSLEWTASSQEEVDRAMAYYSDDRNNEDITTKLADIFDADGHLNRKGASFFKALGVDTQVGMDRYEFNAALLTASGHPNAGTVLRTFGAMVEAIKNNDEAAKSTALEPLARALDLYDFMAENAAKYRNGDMTMDQLMDTVFPRLLAGMANAFGWDSTSYVEKYNGLRRSGQSVNDAGDAALWDFQNDLNTLPRKALDAITAEKSEILVPPDVMADVLGAEPRVQPVLSGLPAQSQLALVACQADVFCKSLFDMPDLKASVPGYQTYFDWLHARNEHTSSEEGHLWTSPGDFELHESADGHALRFGRTPMVFHLEKYAAGKRSVADPQLNEYAALLTGCYDDIAREHPVLGQLRECTKMVAAAQWLKKQGIEVSMPVAGRECVNLPAELPGVIYMVMALKQGPIGEILTAAGGVDYSGDNGWTYKQDAAIRPQGDLVESTMKQTRDKVEQIFGRKIDAPLPEPIGQVSSTMTDGQKVTTLTLSTAELRDAPADVQLQRSPEEQAAFLWKSDDLAGAEQAYRKLIAAASGDPRQAAGYMAILAEILHEKGDNAAAIQTLNEALRLAPNLPILKLLLAKELDASGDLPGAEKALREYIALDPSNAAAGKLLASLQEREKSPGAPAAGGAAQGAFTYSRAIADLKRDERAPELQDITVQPLKLSGRAPDWPDYVKNDQTIISLQKEHDALVATQQKKDADAAQMLKAAEAAHDDAALQSQLNAKAAQLKAESAHAEQQAAKKNDDIKKRAKLLIDTHVAASPEPPSDGGTPPADSPKTGQ